MSIFEHINKQAAIGGAVALGVILALLFYLFGGRSAAPQAVTRLDASPLDGALGRELLTTLSRLRSTKLDTSIFSDPVFMSLRDFGVDIAPQPVGRRNPFAAFDQTGAAAKSGSASPVKRTTGGKTTAPLLQEKDVSGFEFE